MADEHGTRSAQAARAGGLQLSGTNFERAGDQNRRVTLHAICVNGPITRTDLALLPTRFALMKTAGAADSKLWSR